MPIFNCYVSSPEGMMSIVFEYSMFNDIYGHVWPLLFMAMCCAGITIYGHVFLTFMAI